MELITIDMKSLSDQLAGKILNNNHQETELIEEFNNFKSNNPNSLFHDQNSNQTEDLDKGRVGIWKEELVNGKLQYSRDPEESSMWRWWANVNVIPPKTSKKRVVYLGESVARGYLYDPNYYPAKVLENMLNSVSAFDGEVIDLARVSINMDELSKVTSQCFNIQPDVVVIFAGNNWFSSLKSQLTDGEIKRLNRIVDQYFVESGNGDYLMNEAFKPLQEAIEDDIEHMVRKYLKMLSDLSKSNNVPVIFLIPEYNLADWKTTDVEKIISRLSKENTVKWKRSYENLQIAIENKRFEEGVRWGEEMIETDPSHPMGYEMLAECYLNIGDEDKARTNLEKARDTCVFNRSSGQARIMQIIQKTLKQASEEYDIIAIDLPEVYKNHLKNELPGRNLFIDYCHLNDTGIKISMEAVAKEILLLHQFDEVEFDLDAPEFSPTPETHSIANLCAAVHNMHYGQTHDILNYLCKTSVDTSDIAIDLMKDYVEFTSRKLSNSLCKSHERLVERELLDQYDNGAGFLSRRNSKLLDIELVDAMLEVLKANGHDLYSVVDSIRSKDHNVKNGRINMLESYYSRFSYDKQLNRHESYYIAMNTTSEFVFIADKNAPVNLKLTYRTPGRENQQDPIVILINQNEVSRISQSKKWETIEVAVDPMVVREGINRISIEWPYHTAIKKEKVDYRSPEIDCLMDDVVQRFGEVHMFYAYCS